MAACTIANVKADPDLGVSSSFNYVSIYLYYIYIYIYKYYYKYNKTIEVFIHCTYECFFDMQFFDPYFH